MTALDSDDVPSTPRRAVTWRSVLIGTLGVALICAITPYNDFIINNTQLTPSYFPPAITMGLLLILALNTLLRAFAPRRALGGGELAIVLTMLLVGCVVPGWGLMRSLIPLPVAFFHIGQTNGELWRIFSSLDLPTWLFPVDTIADGRNSDVVNAFYSRVAPGEPIPWRAWIIPLLGWGAFFACLAAALLSLAPILRHQWAVNERLAFPLAQLGTMLIEPPPRGRRVNDLLRSPSFWVTAGLVFGLQSLVALHLYFPKNFPAFRLTFDLSSTLAEQPFAALSQHVKRSTIYFTIVGIAYFIPARVAFSLWAIVLIELFTALVITNMGGEVPNGVWDDQHLGACGAVLVGILWVGRAHWWSVLRQAFGKSPGPNEPAMGGWARGFLIAVVGMFAWLAIAGVGPLASTMIVVVLLSVHVIVARVVTETGLPFLRIMATVPQIAANFPTTLFTGREMFFASTSTFFGAIATRESVLPHAMNALQINQSTDESPRPRAVIAVMVWALLLAIVVSSVSSLWCYYTFASPLSENASGQENLDGSFTFPNRFVTDNLVNQAAGRFPSANYNSGVQVAVGAGITGVLQFCVLRFASWPFIPVAYLVSHTWFVRLAWWSILLGWLCKVLILRFGGATLFQRLKPAFVGLIVGEALAAGVWLAIALLLVSLGKPYQVVNFLP